MRHLAFLLLTMIIALSGSSQKAAVMYGSPDNILHEIDCADENNYFSVKLDSNEFKILKYGKKFEILGEEKIDFKFSKEINGPWISLSIMNVRFVDFMDEHLHIVYSIILKKEKKISYYLLKVNKNSLKIEKETEIAKIEFDHLLNLGNLSHFYYCFP